MPTHSEWCWVRCWVGIFSAFFSAVIIFYITFLISMNTNQIQPPDLQAPLLAPPRKTFPPPATIFPLTQPHSRQAICPLPKAENTSGTHPRQEIRATVTIPRQTSTQRTPTHSTITSSAKQARKEPRPISLQYNTRIIQWISVG